MKQKIYLDNNATTLVCDKVIEAMNQELQRPPANPSSIHQWGQSAKGRLSKARSSIASYLKVKPSEVFFTSGGTESMNALIQGFYSTMAPGEILSSSIEHSCVDKSLQRAESLGFTINKLMPGARGCILKDQISQSVNEKTRFIVLSAVNGETGVMTDIEQIAQIAHEKNIPLIIDAVAWLGKEEIYLPKGVSAAGFSAHKFHGPKGVGFCFLRSPHTTAPFLVGGSQEFNLRSGTENLPGIIALQKAIELLEETLPHASMQMRFLRDRFEKNIQQKIPNVLVNGENHRVCNVSNLYFPGIDGETFLIQLDLHGILASHGSACSSGSLEPSRILMGMGYSRERAKSSLRFSISRYTTEHEIDVASSMICQIGLHLLSLAYPKDEKSSEIMCECNK
ncbi:MAG: cysteine desulfurase [Chlamydiae bacterium]|nr:cysteine desulfurase [Chlamydiota bacterium]